MCGSSVMSLLLYADLIITITWVPIFYADLIKKKTTSRDITDEGELIRESLFLFLSRHRSAEIQWYGIQDKTRR